MNGLWLDDIGALDGFSRSRSSLLKRMLDHAKSFSLALVTIHRQPAPADGEDNLKKNLAVLNEA